MTSQIPHPKVLHIIGSKKSGKTRLIEFLIHELTIRGYRVGSFKHSSHRHPLDKPGSDSDRFRRAGASPSVFYTAEGMGLFFNRLPEAEEETIIASAYEMCDIVLVESFRQAAGRKVVIPSPEIDPDELSNIFAIINKNGRHSKYPAFSPLDNRLVDFIIDRFELTLL